MTSLNEISRYLKAANEHIENKLCIESECFDKQLAFIKDSSRFKTAVCSRRAGKTVGCAYDLTRSALSRPGVICLYITLSRVSAKRIIWPEITDINRRFGLAGKVNESELSIKFPNGSIIFLSGAKDKREIEKFRGLPLYLCYVDEAQSFASYIQNLIDEVISKALFDYSGTLCLTGTPGPVPSGFFYDCANSNEWSHHGWTMFENPWIERKSGKTALTLVDEELKRKGVQITDPTIQRECFGKWVIDTNALVIKYDDVRNDYSLDELMSSQPTFWRYVIGVDVGYDDSDAIAVVGYNERLRAAYLIEEDVAAKQGVTELAKKIIALNERYKPDKIVMDTGGLGKKIAEEITKRYEVMIEPAEKARKLEFIELLNDALRTQRFYASKNSRFAQDAKLLEWDTDIDRTKERPKIRDSFHSDICFSAGTLVDTRNGKRKIEQIKPGEEVKTRLGFQKVLASAQTGTSQVVELQFSNGSVLKCTPGHRIFTKNRGFVRADALLYSDSFVSIEECIERRLHSWVAITICKLMGDTSMAGMVRERHIYTEKYGRMSMGLFPRGTTYITGIITHLTTTSRTLSAFLSQITLGFIQKILSKLKHSQSYGINLRLDANGTVFTDVMYSVTGDRSPASARIAAENTKRIACLRKVDLLDSTAATNAERPLEEAPEKTTSNPIARFVAKHLWLTDSENKCFVVGLAQRRIATTPPGPVYNLTVDGIHEYFANGVLVSNCDSVLYSFRESFHWLYAPQSEVAKPGTPQWFEKQVKEMEDVAVENLTREKELDPWKEAQVP